MNSIGGLMLRDRVHMQRYTKLVLVVNIILWEGMSYAQSDDTTKKAKLQEMGFFSYPTSVELSKNVFCDSVIQSAALSSQDINAEFSNTSDLDWLKDVAQKKKAVLLGEEHYSAYIANIRNRILFYLNTIDYFPLLVLEAQYSYTGYYNYYINLTDDMAAEKFFAENLHPMVTDEDICGLLHHLRSWNKIHFNKKITIGFSDVEHDYLTTINKVVLPYLQKVDKMFSIDAQNFSLNDLGKVIPTLRRLHETARSQNIVGEYPFLTADYISTIIDNLEATFKAYFYEFSFYRQKAIIRNLTDVRIFGKYFETSKVLLHGGAYHMPSHFSYPDEGNFYREGSYLSEEYGPTKGKTYSINLHCFSRSLGSMATIEIDSCLQQGSSYRNLVRRWQMAYKGKLITDTEILFEFQMNDLHKLITRRSENSNRDPIVVSKMDWPAILRIARNIDIQLYSNLKGWADEYDQYDIHVFVPQSPFNVARNKSIRQQ